MQTLAFSLAQASAQAICPGFLRSHGDRWLSVIEFNQPRFQFEAWCLADQYIAASAAAQEQPARTSDILGVGPAERTTWSA